MVKIKPVAEHIFVLLQAFYMDFSGMFGAYHNPGGNYIVMYMQFDVKIVESRGKECFEIVY